MTINLYTYTKHVHQLLNGFVKKPKTTSILENRREYNISLKKSNSPYDLSIAHMKIKLTLKYS